MGSTRLPGKVLKPLAGDTVLGHVVRRVRLAKRLDAICIATTESPGDEPIVTECARLGVGCWRGSEHDVLSRYFDAARAGGADVIVRVTSDCPLFDGALLDEMLAVFHANPGLDYLSNVQVRRFPRGLDAEVFTFAALARAHREATRAALEPVADDLGGARSRRQRRAQRVPVALHDAFGDGVPPPNAPVPSMSSTIQWCEGPSPSVNRPSHTACVDSDCCAIAPG